MKGSSDNVETVEVIEENTHAISSGQEDILIASSDAEDILVEDSDMGVIFDEADDEAPISEYIDPLFDEDDSDIEVLEEFDLITMLSDAEDEADAESSVTVTLKHTDRGIKRVAEEEVVRPPKRKRLTKRASRKVEHSKKPECPTCKFNLNGPWQIMTGAPCSSNVPSMSHTK